MTDIQSIKHRYNSSEYFEYPKMEELITKVMKNPDAEVVIPDEFLDAKNDKRGLLLGLITKITITLKHLWNKMKKVFSKAYRTNYRVAVEKIAKKYGDLVSDIYTQSVKAISSYQKAAFLRDQLKGLVNDVEKNESDLEKVNKELVYIQHKNCNVVSRLYHGIDLESEKKEIEKIDPLFFSIGSISEESLRKEQERLIQTGLDLDKKVDSITKEVEECVKQCELALKKVEDLTHGAPESRIHDEQLGLIQGAIKGDWDGKVGDSDVGRSEQYQQMMKDIDTKTGCRPLKTLWQTLLNNVPDLDERIDSWRCSDNGNFTLKLKRPLKIWIDVNEPKGGCIFLFGDYSDHVVKGSLSKDKITFDSGYESKCYNPGSLGPKFVKPRMGGFFFKKPTSINGSGTVNMPGTFWGVTKSKDSSVSVLKKAWSQQSNEVLSDEMNDKEYENFLRAKRG